VSEKLGRSSNGETTRLVLLEKVIKGMMLNVGSTAKAMKISRERLTGQDAVVDDYLFWGGVLALSGDYYL